MTLRVPATQGFTLALGPRRSSSTARSRSRATQASSPHQLLRRHARCSPSATSPRARRTGTSRPPRCFPDPRPDRRARRYRLRERERIRLRQLLRAELGQARPTQQGGAGQPRVQHRRRDGLLPVLRSQGRSRPPRLLQLRHRRLALHHAQLQLPIEVGGCERDRRRAAGSRPTSRRIPPVHARVLAPPTIQLRPPWRRRGLRWFLA